jgi:uncharacterized protein YhfF
MSFKVVNGLRTIEFGTPGEMRDRLNALVVDGSKRATAATLQEYLAEGEPVESIGEELYLLDNQGSIVAKVRITESTQCRFADVPDRFALAEGEGDLNGNDFRKSHRDYWSRVGIEINEETPVVLLYFDLIEQY